MGRLVLLACVVVLAAGWRPVPGEPWQWQLTGRVDPAAVDARVADVDLFETPASLVRALQARGVRVVCYLSAGTFEPWRPDAARVPRAAIGRPLAGWPDERWLDVRRLGALRPWLAARMDLCRAKGFDGVEPDNVDAYANRSGFPLRGRDQLRFNRMVARLAHARGLAVALKNDLGQAAALEPSFDWALVEECVQFRECARLRPFTRAGKAVWAAEYAGSHAAGCATAERLGLDLLRKRLRLDAFARRC